MPYIPNPTWQDSPATTTPITAALLNRLEAAVAAAAPASSAWTASTPVKAGQLLTNAGVLYQVIADMTTPGSFATTGLTTLGVAASLLGAANGVATLDAGSKVPVGQIPDLSAIYPPLSGNNHFSGLAAFGGAAVNGRSPVASLQNVSPATAGTNDLVAHNFSTVISGDFSGAGVVGAPDPSYAWGADIYTATGQNANDGKGANIGTIIETYSSTPAGSTIPLLYGLEVSSGFLGSTAGNTITDLRGLFVNGPNNFTGAAGVATSAVSLWVDPPAIGTSRFSVLVSGGITRLQGRLDVTDSINNISANDLNIFANIVGDLSGARLGLMQAVNGGHAHFRVYTANAALWVVGSAGVKHSFVSNGNSALGSIGSFGGGVGVVSLVNATTLPATSPVGGGVLYVNAGALTYKGSSGTVTVLAPA